jgi:hypothetical protein
MRFLTLLKSGDNSQAGPPPMELFAAIGKLGEEAKESGVLVDTGGLAASAMGGARVRLSGGNLDVADGPFNEDQEFGSYALYEVNSKEEVVDWASRFMNLHKEYWAGWEGETEIIRVMGPEDFAPPS